MESENSQKSAPTSKRANAKTMRGVYERNPGEWWIRYADTTGRIRREKAGTWAAARDLYHKRKTEVLQGRKLPEKLRRPRVSFAEISKDARSNIPKPIKFAKHIESIIGTWKLC